MLPSIALVYSVEMIRDGGSLAAIFQGSDAAKYWLFIKIDNGTNWERTHYLQPIVYERPHGPPVGLSWQHAKVFLNQMRGLLRTRTDEVMFEVMMEVIDVQGKRSYDEVIALMKERNWVNK